MCEPGSIFPRAAAGFYAEAITIEAGENFTQVIPCIPVYACLGTCPPEVVTHITYEESFSEDDTSLAQSLEKCGPGLGFESCTTGYEGYAARTSICILHYRVPCAQALRYYTDVTHAPRVAPLISRRPRCSLCASFDNKIDCNAGSINGFYRLDERCEPCPCTLLTFPVMIGIVFVVALLFLFALELVGTDFIQHASTLGAPALIMVSFAQTVAVFLDTGIPWPPFLRQLMLSFSFLNFNIELARPECSGEFGALQKVRVALHMPIFVGSVIFAYGSIALIRIQCQSEATAEQRRSARHVLMRKLASFAATFFTVGAIFFARSFLRAFDCVSSEVDTTKQFMRSSPEIECADSDPEYPDVRRLSEFGLVGFGSILMAMVLSMIKAHHSDGPGLGMFAFLSDKFEDHFYFWEFVIIVRKVLMMAVFLLFNRLVAVLLATFITIFSLSIHIAARPFEDTGTDWTELLSLAAQLITLTSGPVFIVLVRPADLPEAVRVLKLLTYVRMA